VRLSSLLRNSSKDDLLLAGLLAWHARDGELRGGSQHQLALLVIAGELWHGGVLAVSELWLLNHLELAHRLRDHLAWHSLRSPWLTYSHAMHGCPGLHWLPRS